MVEKSSNFNAVKVTGIIMAIIGLAIFRISGTESFECFKSKNLCSITKTIPFTSIKIKNQNIPYSETNRLFSNQKGNNYYLYIQMRDNNDYKVFSKSTQFKKYFQEEIFKFQMFNESNDNAFLIVNKTIGRALFSLLLFIFGVYLLVKKQISPEEEAKLAAKKHDLPDFMVNAINDIEPKD